MADLPENERCIIHLDDASLVQVGPSLFRKRILRFGEWDHPSAPGGRLKVDKAYCERLIKNFQAKVWDIVAVPFGHPKDEGAGALVNAGETVGLEMDDDGLYGLLSITPEHVAKIGTTVKGCSAGLIPNYVDHEVNGLGAVGPVLAHVALTNEPYIKGLGDFSPVQLAHDGAAVVLSAVKTQAQDPQEGIASMDKDELIAKLKELGIDVAELTAKADKVEDLESRLAAVKPVAEVQAETEADLVAALAEALTAGGMIQLAEGQTVGSKAQVVAAIAAVAKSAQDAKVELAESKADAAVDAAIKSGRAVPAQRDALRTVYLTDTAVFEALLPKDPFVNFSEMGHDGSDLENHEGAPADHSTEVERLATLAKSV